MKCEMNITNYSPQTSKILVMDPQYVNISWVVFFFKQKSKIMLNCPPSNPNPKSKIGRLSELVHCIYIRVFTVQTNDKCTIINILEPESTLYYKELKLKAISNVTFIPGCLSIYLKNEELLTV